MKFYLPESDRNNDLIEAKLYILLNRNNFNLNTIYCVKEIEFIIV